MSFPTKLKCKKRKRTKDEEYIPTINKTKKKQKIEIIKTKKKKSKRRRKQNKIIEYNDDILTKNNEQLTIFRNDPTLKTINGDILKNDKEIFEHYHKYLRDDEGSNWQNSIKVGDILEFKYSSTYKSRLSRLSNLNHINVNNNNNNNNKYDMPKWIPIQVICKAYSVTIEYINNNKNDENKSSKPLQQKIKVGIGGTIKNYSRFKINLKCAKIRGNNLKCGEIIEIFNEEINLWEKCKIIELLTFIEFEYISYFSELIYDSCYIDELNIRLPLQCIPNILNNNIDNDLLYIGREIRVYWSHDWYQAIIQSIDFKKKILILFYNDKYMEQLRYNIKTTLFYFPIKSLKNIISWIYLRPNCKFCGSFMKEKTVTKCKYQNNHKCWQCDHKFVEKDSIWICPFEKKIKYHPRKYYLDSNCCNIKKENIIHPNKTLLNNNDNNNNTNLKIGHKNNITKMAELYRISIGNPLPHLQFIDNNDNNNNNNNNDDSDDNIDEIIETNKYLENYICKLYHCVLYQPFDKKQYFKLCKKYLFTNFIPLKRNRNTPLNNDDIIIASKYLFSTKLQKIINIFLKNDNQHSLFYILKAIELKYFFICNAWNGRPKSFSLTNDLTMQYQWNSNMKHNLIPPILNNQNNKIINQITKNHKIINKLKQKQFIKYTNNPILSGSISHNNNNNNNNNDDYQQDENEENEQDENEEVQEIFFGRMGAFCIPQFDICIIIQKEKEKEKENEKQTQQREEKEELIYKTASAIIINCDTTNLCQREHEWRLNRESSRSNPWIRGDFCMIFADQISTWLQAKIIKIYKEENECKVDIYSKELNWPKYRTYGGLSQYIMPKINKNINIKDINDIPLIDRLQNGTKIKLWCPTWKFGTILWKWNENDLCCIQLNGQRLQYSQTFHVNDPKWKIQIVPDNNKSNNNDDNDDDDIQPPLQFIMAKSKYLALSNDIINSGLVIFSDNDDNDDDDDDDYYYSENDNDENKEQEEINDNNQEIQVLDLTQTTTTTISGNNKTRQKLNKIKIIKLQKNKLNERIISKKDKRTKKKRIKKKKKKQEGIDVYGIEEGDIFYINQIINIKWKLNRCIIYDDIDDDDENENILNEKQFNIYLECKNYFCQTDGKVDIQTDKILLYSHISLIPNSNDEYSYNVPLPISFLNYYDNNKNSQKQQQQQQQQAICYIRVVFINNDYYFYRLNGTSNIFELRNQQNIDIDIDVDIDYNDDNDNNNDEKQQEKQDESKEEKEEKQQQEEEEEEEGKRKQEKEGKNAEEDEKEKKDEIEFEDDTAINANDEIHKKDNGALCICGAVQYNIDIPIQDDDNNNDDNMNEKNNNNKNKNEWIQCDYCYTWQHIDCLQIDKNNFNDYTKYQCLWCIDDDDDDNLQKYFNNCKTTKMLKFIKNLFAASLYKGKRYGFWSKKREKFNNNDNNYDISYLQNLCIERGVDGSSTNKNELESNLIYCSKFARTPLTLSNFMCSLFGINDIDNNNKKIKKLKLNCVDLMAGNGNITKFISSYHNIFAIEKKEERMECGKRLVPNAKWICMDIFSKEFISNYVINKTYDIIYCNPDLNNIIPAIYIGLQMIKNSKFKDKCLIYLLPIDCFETNSFQCRLFRILNCYIDRMYQVGRWNYFKKTNDTHPKSICDAVWIIKIGTKSSKYKFRCYDVRSNHKLTAKSFSQY